ncbi:hypothetical protein V8C37DRAFT_213082 [Trichoderma ceciliae]
MCTELRSIVLVLLVLCVRETALSICPNEPQTQNPSVLPPALLFLLRIRSTKWCYSYGVRSARTTTVRSTTAATTTTTTTTTMILRRISHVHTCHREQGMLVMKRQLCWARGTWHFCQSALEHPSY